MSQSMTVEIGKMQKEVDAKNREIGDLWLQIARLEVRNILLEAVYAAVKDWPENDQTMALRYALADMENKR